MQLKAGGATVNTLTVPAQLYQSAIDEELLGNELSGIQLGATPVNYVVCRCSNILPLSS
jgi:hypothetical protein